MEDAAKLDVREEYGNNPDGSELKTDPTTEDGTLRDNTSDGSDSEWTVVTRTKTKKKVKKIASPQPSRTTDNNYDDCKTIRIYGNKNKKPVDNVALAPATDDFHFDCITSERNAQWARGQPKKVILANEKWNKVYGAVSTDLPAPFKVRFPKLDCNMVKVRILCTTNNDENSDGSESDRTAVASRQTKKKRRIEKKKKITENEKLLLVN